LISFQEPLQLECEREKKCPSCNLIKPISEFHVDPTKTGGRSSHCANCKNKARRRSYFKPDLQAEKMNQRKFDSIFRELNPLYKKVFGVVPPTHPWNVSEICEEIRRSAGHGMDMRTLNGCLNGLVEHGLVREPRRGFFVRTEIRKYSPTSEAVEQISEPQTKVPDMPKPQSIADFAETPKNTLLDRLTSFADRLRSLATELETAALELSVMAEKSEADSEKLRQLQKILQSLG
jgi:hypothetical protein